MERGVIVGGAYQHICCEVSESLLLFNTWPLTPVKRIVINPANKHNVSIIREGSMALMQQVNGFLKEHTVMNGGLLNHRILCLKISLALLFEISLHLQVLHFRVKMSLGFPVTNVVA